MSLSPGRPAAFFLTTCIAFFILLNSADLSRAQPVSIINFEVFAQKRFASKAGWDRERFCPVSTSVVARRVLESYGAIFAAHESVVLPPGCIFRGESDVIKYQKNLQTTRIDMSGIAVDLQTPAVQPLARAMTEAADRGFRITAYEGPIAGSRTYGQTLMLWNSRFFPALEYWVTQGVLSEADRREVGGMDLEKKIERVLEWESRGIYFSTNRTRSIMTSTAPPGTSQHLAMIALDIAEYSNPDVRAILNRNGWYQTVVDDPPHFTYLGHAEADLPGRGLRAIYKGSQLYWIPNIPATIGTITD